MSSSDTKGQRRTWHAGNAGANIPNRWNGTRAKSGIDYGRTFSGASRGLSIGHVSPEAAEGGPLAFVENGDHIIVDIEKRILDVQVPEEEWEKRKANWKGFEPKVKTGYLARYSKLVTSANTGGIMKI